MWKLNQKVPATTSTETAVDPAKTVAAPTGAASALAKVPANDTCPK